MPTDMTDRCTYQTRGQPINSLINISRSRRLISGWNTSTISWTSRPPGVTRSPNFRNGSIQLIGLEVTLQLLLSSLCARHIPISTSCSRRKSLASFSKKLEQWGSRLLQSITDTLQMLIVSKIFDDAADQTPREIQARKLIVISAG